MFLITTALEKSWKSNEKILFLGEWCKIYSRKHVWSKFDFDILPYHWAVKNKRDYDYKYLNNIYEIYLPILSRKLNDIHGYNHTDRYWRIVIGHWLSYFINVLYDRYYSIKSAMQYGKISSTILLTSDKTNWIAKNYNQFSEYVKDDKWNHYIFSEIIKLLNAFPYETIETPNLPANSNQSIKSRFLKMFSNNTYKCYSKLIPSEWKNIVFIDTHFALNDLLKLQIKLRQFPFPYYASLDIPRIDIDNQMRDEIFINRATNEYEKILEKLLPSQIPSVHLENYSQTRKIGMSYFPNNPKMIYTETAQAVDNAFKLWAAEKVESGVKLLTAQHGGVTGSGLWEEAEEHYIKISDKYYTFGWTKDHSKNVKPLSNGVLIKAKKNMVASPNGDILCVLTTLPRYHYRFFSCPQGPMFQNYMKTIIDFANSVSSEVHDIIKFRLDKSYNWKTCVKEQLISHGFEDMIDKINIPITKRLNKCRLCIVTTNNTTLLETLSANFPTLAFWNREDWELRTEAIPYYEELNKVGILHYDIKSIINKLDSIYHDPLLWWHSESLQAAVKRFRNQFAHVNNDWLLEWEKEIKLN